MDNINRWAYSIARERNEAYSDLLFLRKRNLELSQELEYLWFQVWVSLIVNLFAVGVVFAVLFF